MTVGNSVLAWGRCAMMMPWGFFLGLCSETLSVSTFHYVQTHLQDYHEMILTQKKEAIIWSRRFGMLRQSRRWVPSGANVFKSSKQRLSQSVVGSCWSCDLLSLPECTWPWRVMQNCSTVSIRWTDQLMARYGPVPKSWKVGHQFLAANGNLG